MQFLSFGLEHRNTVCVALTLRELSKINPRAYFPESAMLMMWRIAANAMNEMYIQVVTSSSGAG